jgi:methyl-accepting chemotaxis protein
MRSNLPVTQNEVKLTEQSLIVSKTDLKGRITYVNKDFLDISGFTEKELIGEPHNIVRHPDMPVEAFEDMWQTLKEGRPWTGYVKNRCKNGDYYWVLANATPIWENGAVSGYMSVRRKADAGAISEVEALYAKFRSGQQGNLKIRHGRAASGSGWIEKLSLGHRIAGLLVLLGAMVVAMAIVSLMALSKTNDATVSLYEQRFHSVRIIGRITQLMAENRMQIGMSGIGVHHDPTVEHADHTAYMVQVRKNMADITALWEEYQKAVVNEEHRQLAGEYEAMRGRFVGEGLKPAVEAIERGDNGVAWDLFQNKVNPLFIQAVAKADVLVAQRCRIPRTALVRRGCCRSSC